MRVLGRVLLLACAVLSATAAHGAEVTHVASSFEVDAPFGADASIGFAHSTQTARIRREDFTNGESEQLTYYRSVRSMPMRIAIGVFRDVQLSVGTALVLGDKRSWNYPSGLDPTKSTVAYDCVDSMDNNICANGATGKPLFAAPNAAYRAGLDNIGFGLSFAAMNEVKEPGHPTWVLGFEYVAPTAKLNNPATATSSSEPGGIGDKVARFNLSTALSKRVGLFDPYFKVTYSIPSTASSAFSNCDNASQLGFGANCINANWAASDTGLKPQQIVSFLVGSEVVPWHDGADRKVGIDLQFGLKYLSEGRVYNELSDALQRLLYTEDYVSVGASLGAYVRFASFGQIRLDGGIYAQTNHFLTNESFGKDLDGLCGGTTPGCVDYPGKDPSTKKTLSPGAEVNPNFDPRYDMPTRRFRISNSTVTSVALSAVFNY